MIINYLKLSHFRNYHNLELNFSKGINYIYGSNGSGKTSIVEAIYYLSLLRSFKTSKDSLLINSESTDASIFASIYSRMQEKYIGVHLSPEGKKIIVNEKFVKKNSELSSLVNCICFTPEDCLLLKDAPKERRSFVDISISKTNKIYLKQIIDYEKLLKTRNEHLKDLEIDKDLIDVFTSQMIDLSKEIYLERRNFFNNLNVAFKKVYKEISKKDSEVEIVYKPFIDNSDMYKEIALEKYENSFDYDVKHKQTSIGIQKEDFYINLNGKNVGLYGSQGENRLIVLALKLAPYELINDIDDKPIVILDDVLSELDNDYKYSLINYLSKLNQVFITSANKEIIENTNYYLVKDKQVMKGE